MKSKFKVSGLQRRALKRELSDIRSRQRYFWSIEDCCRVYGGGMADELCEEYLLELDERALSLEKILIEKNITDEINS